MSKDRAQVKVPWQEEAKREPSQSYDMYIASDLEP